MPVSSTKGKVQERPLLHKLLHASPPVLLDLVCGISDDVATCYKLGLLPDRIGIQAEKMADWCWFASTLVGLVEVGVEDGIISSAIRESMSYVLRNHHFGYLYNCMHLQSKTVSTAKVWPVQERFRWLAKPQTSKSSANSGINAIGCGYHEPNCSWT